MNGSKNGSQSTPSLAETASAPQKKKSKKTKSKKTKSRKGKAEALSHADLRTDLNHAEPIAPPTRAKAKKQAKLAKDAIEAYSSTRKPKKFSKKFYENELNLLQIELVKLQYWVKHHGLRVAILFEGRDAAGKGSAIKRIVDCMNPRGCRVVALSKPSDVEKTQWYFQRYVAHLPSAGEIVLFDRSWYNRAGVERVMGFCTKAEYQEFMQSCPEFERMLVRSGIILLKYWFSVSDEEQEKRFQERVQDPVKRWKLSPMDLESRDRWEDYSRAKDEMFAHTNIPEAPWFTVDSSDKRRSRLNLIRHILSKIPYQDITPAAFELPPRKPPSQHYVRPPINEQFFVPEYY